MKGVVLVMKTPLTPNEYKTAIKNDASGGWLFFGDEEYLKHYALELTRKTVLGDGALNSPAHRKLDCFEFDIEAITDAVSTVSLFDALDGGSKRLTELHELQFGSLKESEWKQLEELLGAFNGQDDTVLIVYTTPDEFDAGNLPKAPSKALSRLAEYLTPVNFAYEDDTKLIKWIAKHLAAEKLKPDVGVCELILDRVGHDMYTLSNEINKLCAYVHSAGRDIITSADVENVTCSNLESDSFSFTNALLTRDCDKAYALLNSMMLKKEKAVVVLGSVARTAADLYTVRQLSAAGMTAQEISKKLKMHEYRVKLYTQYAKERSVRKLRSLVDECSKADMKLKNSTLDEYTLLSRLVVLFAAK